MERIIDNPDERTWGMLCHLSALAGAVIPFGNIIGPLIVYSVKRQEYGFVEDQGKEALNFQITMSILLIVSAILVVIVIGIFLLIAIGLLSLIFTVIGALKANQGEFYRYPFNIRFLK
ncbi:DUF4870 domain-containing protein [Gaoshiqia sediminis]|uniref:DUF4870 domain-containing protein n=1 Tax=Gaoshiqia sediminis TaxID=2986998 RepID=A0AA42C6S0_9BACT|nr:DUF4870 domain-containing protein [Gaoshiqia sediminis]MCW0482824.1 DUF4870 domain-containing protein [Gaoshiqia sediminis]